MEQPDPNPHYHGSVKIVCIPLMFCPDCFEELRPTFREGHEVILSKCRCGTPRPPLNIAAFTQEFASISYEEVRKKTWAKAQAIEQEAIRKATPPDQYPLQP